MSLLAYKVGEFKPTQKVTVYRKSEFCGNIVKTEMKLIEFGIESYAQYDSCPFVVGVPKRKRSAYKMLESYNPYMIIVDGWNNIEPNGLYEGGKDLGGAEGVTVTQAKYSSCSDGYAKDFDSIIDFLIADKSVKVLADYRGHDSQDRFRR